MAGTPFNPDGSDPNRPGVGAGWLAPTPPTVAKPGSSRAIGVGRKQPGAAGGNPLIDAMLGLLGGGGGGGSYYGGYDGTAARNAARSAYDTQLGNTKNVYGQIVGNVQARQPAIQQGYQDATAKINADAQARAAADASRNQEADQRNMATAAALGLDVAAPTDTQADALRQAGTNAYQSNAQAWTGFNDASSKTAVERNTATGDAFQYAGAQTETQLAAMLQQALAAIAGQEAANPGGYSGGGGSSSGTDLKILTTLLGYDLDQQKLAASSQGKQNPLSALSPGGWQAIQQAYGGVSSLGVGNAQAQSLALKNLANNPRDFATLYAALNG